MITDGTDFNQSERNVFRITVDRFKLLINIFFISNEIFNCSNQKVQNYKFRVG